jgi:hypothetical protein
VLDDLFNLPERKVLVESNLATVQEYILGKLKKGKQRAQSQVEDVSGTIGWSWIFTAAAVAAAAGIILLRARNK